MIEPIAWLVDSASKQGNPEHALAALLGPQNILIEAPAGCGKTHALAERARSLIAHGAVKSPRRILALSYSNRAKDNLRSQLRDAVGVRYWERVTVTNFHGFALRLILAHGEIAGLDAGVEMPQRRRLRQLRDGAGVTWRNADEVDTHLRAIKCTSASDAEVWDYLSDVGDRIAQEYQSSLSASGMLDYDDLLRHAERILEYLPVAKLYSCHFPVVMVDELQDLTLQHLRIARAVCGEGLTACGDRAQGIYAFAGAKPAEVFSQVGEMKPARIVFNLSYRSSPLVLSVVNVLAALQGSLPLRCANEEDWVDRNGAVLTLETEAQSQEADEVLDWAMGTLLAEPQASVGIIVRRGTRGEVLREHALRRGVDVEVWSEATHNQRIVRLLQRHVSQAVAASEEIPEQIDALQTVCKADIPPDDVELLDDLADAIATFRELVAEGVTLRDCVDRCRSAPHPDVPVAPGLHLLTSHTGKGQQFDWVVVLGLEEGKLPDFRSTSDEALAEELRVLHVVVSRARVGLVLTAVRREKDKYERWHPVERSRWWANLEPLRTSTL